MSTEVARRAGVEMVENRRDILGDVDVLSLHLPLTPQTLDIVDADVLAALKPAAIPVNAARGGLVDEAALYTALTNPMSDGAAALDTFAVERPAAETPLLGLPNEILRSHRARLTIEAARRMGIVAAENVVNGHDGVLDPELTLNRQLLAAWRLGQLA